LTDLEEPATPAPIDAGQWVEASATTLAQTGEQWERVGAERPSAPPEARWHQTNGRMVHVHFFRAQEWESLEGSPLGRAAALGSRYGTKEGCWSLGPVTFGSPDTARVGWSWIGDPLFGRGGAVQMILQSGEWTSGELEEHFVSLTIVLFALATRITFAISRVQDFTPRQPAAFQGAAALDGKMPDAHEVHR
jgi:hypothetical protein